MFFFFFFFFFQAEDGIRDHCVTGVQTCALPILARRRGTGGARRWHRRGPVGDGLVPRSRARSCAADRCVRRTWPRRERPTDRDVRPHLRDARRRAGGGRGVAALAGTPCRREPGTPAGAASAAPRRGGGSVAGLRRGGGGPAPSE